MPSAITISRNPVLTGTMDYMRNLRPSAGPSAALAEAGTFSNYSHKIRGLGGFWQCGFVWHGEMPVLMEMIAEGWMRDIRVMGNRGMEVWEGFNAGMELSLTGGMPALKVTGYGHFRTLFSRVYNQGGAPGVLEDISVEIANILGTGTIGQFIVLGAIETNTSEVDRYHNSDRTAGDILFDMCAAGDVLNHRYMIGCYEGKKLRYEQIARYETGAAGRLPAYIVDGLQGGIILKASIDQFANEVWVRHTPPGGALTRTPAGHSIDAASKLKFGQKDLPLNGGSASVAIATLISGTCLSFQGAPGMPDITIGPGTVIKDQYGNVVPPEEIRPNNWMLIENLALPSSAVFSSLIQNPSALFIEEVAYSEDSGLGITANRDRFTQAQVARLAGRGAG